MAADDPTLKVVNRPTHTPHGDEVPPLYAAEIPTAPKSPGARRGSATEAASSTEADKEATES